MTIPNPMGCGLCGIDQRPHGIQVSSAGTHTWEPPTDEQIIDRLRARRAAKETK